VAADSGQLIVEAPPGTLTDADRVLIRKNKPDLMRLAAETLRHVAGALPLLSMPLGEFARCGALLEVRVPWLNVTLWLVPAERDLGGLLCEGVGRGRIWTAAELSELLSLEARPAVKALANAKLAMDGEIVAVRRRT
jgi:hypothetical protein